MSELNSKMQKFVNLCDVLGNQLLFEVVKCDEEKEKEKNETTTTR